MSYILHKKHWLVGVTLITLFSCSNPTASVNKKGIEKQIEDGNFTLAEKQIDSLLSSTIIKPEEQSELDSLKQIMQRIRLDFSLDEQKIKTQLDAYFDELADSQIKNWEQSGKLEMRIIDQEKKYFYNAVPNLFRLDPTAKAFIEKRFGIQVGSLDLFCLEHTQKIIEASKNSSDPVLPVDLILTYTLRVKPNVVPAGTNLRCWLPMPREGKLRQRNFFLLSSNPKNVTIAPPDYLQQTAYMEKKTEKDQPTIFQIQFSIQTLAQYFDLEPTDIQPYDTQSKLYKDYTKERPPHLAFTPEIKALGSRIVGDETNPLRKIEKIYHWINDSIPWASALEYSTMPNIPAYVMHCRHGDCGMQTLLFMSLARSQGIPAKWQSGFMLHPGHVNLHDWCEVYYEGIGWVPVDQSFKLQKSENRKVREFYVHGIDSYRLIVNDDYAQELFPPKKYLRSEPYDLQRGEVEWDGGNLYFDQWSWNMSVERTTL